MSSEATIRVYAFALPGTMGENDEVSRFKASRRTIVELLGGRVLEGTGEDVPTAEVDPRGLYRRYASAWGDLPD